MSIESSSVPAAWPTKVWRRLAAWPVDCWQSTLFWLFALSVLLFPFGQAFRVLLPLLCLPVLLILYVKDWQGRALRHLPVWWLLAFFFVAVALELMFANWFGPSWKAVRPNLLRGFLLPFIGMECVRSLRDLTRLTGIFAAVSLIEGCNGLWQFATGADLITATVPMTSGVPGPPFEPGSLESLRFYRLTGALSSYRVGNYMALIGLPACGLILLWPVRRAFLRVLLTMCLLSPAIFLWIGAQARSGYLAAGGGLYLAWLLLRRPHLVLAAVPFVGTALLVVFGPDRISLMRALGDERRYIWEQAWECFMAHPWLGTGPNSYFLASEALGVTVLPTGNDVPPHPHNIYLQWLVDGGVIGFSLMSVSLIGLALWAGLTIRRGLLAAQHKPDAEEATLFWGLGTFYWAGWCAFLINGVAAHGFYRTWWISTAFSLLGVMLGICVRGRRLSSSPA